MKGLVRGAAGLVLTLLSARAASAADATSVVIVAEGPDARTAREEIAANLGDGYAVVPTAALMSAMAQSGQKGPWATLLAAPKKRAALFEKIERASQATHVDDVVIVVTYRTRSGHKLATLYVVDASGEASPELRAAVAAADSPLADAVSRQLQQLHPAPKAAPVAAAVPAPSNESPKPDAPPAVAPLVGVDPVSGPIGGSEDRAVTVTSGRVKHRPGREWFDVAAGLEGGMRRFSYHDGFSQNLRDYVLSAAPLATLDGSLYPFANSGTLLLDDVGFVLGYAQAFAVQSQASGRGSLGTEWQRFHAGGRVRVRTGSSARAVVLDVLGAYGGESFYFEGSSPTASYPSVEYRYVRTLGEARIPIGRFAVTADGGYLFVLSPGDVAARFPHSSVGGIEGSVGGAFTILEGFEARLSLSYRRFFYSMNSEPGDSFVAGGALDQFWGLSGSLAYVY